MADKMTGNELLGIDEPDGIGEDDLLDNSFTADDDLDTPATLKNIFDDHHSEDSAASPPSPRSRLSDKSYVSSLMRNDIVEEEWRNDARDLRHRKQILLQVANLLLARKQNPTKEWLKELPYKARKLEEQLYRGAPTLQDYLDKATLKHRLKRVAKIIVSNYRAAKAKRERKPSPRRSKPSSMAADPASFLSAMSDQTPPHSNLASFHSTSGRRSSMRSSASMSFASELATFQMLNDHQMGTRRNSSLPQANLMTQRSMIQGTDIALEEQKLVNQKLQQRIVENIRQQQQLMRELMVQTNKSKMAQRSAMLNIANPPPTHQNVSALAHSILRNAQLPDQLQLMNNHQLPMNLLQQSLARSLAGGGGGGGGGGMQRQGYHSNMPPPSICHSFNSGPMFDDNNNVNPSPNSFHW